MHLVFSDLSHDKTNKMTFAPLEDPAVWVFAVRFMSRRGLFEK